MQKIIVSLLLFFMSTQLHAQYTTSTSFETVAGDVYLGTLTNGFVMVSKTSKPYDDIEFSPHKTIIVPMSTTCYYVVSVSTNGDASLLYFNGGLKTLTVIRGGKILYLKRRKPMIF